MSDDKPSFCGIEASTFADWRSSAPLPVTPVDVKAAFERAFAGMMDAQSEPEPVMVHPKLLRQYEGVMLLIRHGDEGFVYIRPKPRWVPRRLWAWLCCMVTVYELPEYEDGVLYLGDKDTRASLPIDTARLPWSAGEAGEE